MGQPSHFRACIRALGVAVASSVIIGSLVHAATPKKLNAFAEGDRLVYTRLVESFRKNERDQVLRQRALLERNYPNSIHLDNAYYLSGMAEYQHERYGEAVRAFGTVRERFPRSNKRPAALFALGVTYEKLGLQPQAIGVWRQLIKEYPGSMESRRAEMHLELEKSASRKK
ncbi:MAG: tol-pal system YbgF family protein [Bdellovibrionales bacterium]